MSNAFCPHCAWPVVLSLDHCAICGETVEPGAASVQSGDLASRLIERWLIHGLVLFALPIGKLLFAAWLFRGQMLITIFYFVMVVWWFSDLKPSDSSNSSRSGDTFRFAGKNGEAILFSTVALLVLVLVTYDRPEPTSPARPQVGAMKALPRVKETPEQQLLRQQGERTKAYLHTARQLTATFMQQKLTNQQRLERIKSVATQLESISATGVDAQAVEYVFELSEVLRMMIAFVERAQAPEYYIESFVRGMSGDPFGAALELNEYGQNVSRETAKIDSTQRRLKAVLESKYNMPFD